VSPGGKGAMFNALKYIVILFVLAWSTHLGCAIVLAGAVPTWAAVTLAASTTVLTASGNLQGQSPPLNSEATIHAAGCCSSVPVCG